MTDTPWHERPPSTTRETRYKCRHRPCEGRIIEIEGIPQCSSCGEFWYPPRRRPKPAPPVTEPQGIAADALKAMLQARLHLLPLDQRVVFSLRHGLDGGPRVEIADIAALFRKSPEWVEDTHFTAHNALKRAMEGNKP